MVSVKNFFVVGMMVMLFFIMSKIIVNKYSIFTPIQDIVNMA